MPIPRAELDLYEQALADVTTLAQRDLLASWRHFDFTDALAARDALLDIFPDLVAKHHLTAATVAADWYDVQRHDAGARKRYQAHIADEPPVEQSQAVARWAIGPLFSAAPDVQVALANTAGGLQRLSMAGARNTILTSTRRDPARPGWRRVGTGSCDLCRLLIGRGAVYSADTGDFKTHNLCGCYAVPEFD